MYQPKFELALKKHGYEESKIGPATKKKIDQVKDAMAALKQLYDDKEQIQDEAERDLIQQSIEKMEKNISILDDAAVINIERQEMYKSRGFTKAREQKRISGVKKTGDDQQNLQTEQPGTQTTAQNSTNTENTEIVNKTDDKSSQTAEVIENQNNDEVVEEVIEDKPKKKNYLWAGIGIAVFTGLVAAVTSYTLGIPLDLRDRFNRNK